MKVCTTTAVVGVVISKSGTKRQTNRNAGSNTALSHEEADTQTRSPTIHKIAAGPRRVVEAIYCAALPLMFRKSSWSAVPAVMQDIPTRQPQNSTCSGIPGLVGPQVTDFMVSNENVV